MPLLDVTEVLIDPMFQDTTLSVVRSVETVGSNGRNTFATTTTPFAGVVVQASGDQLQRQPDGSMHTDSINIYTQFQLVSGESATVADVVTWQGRRYTVMRVLDWSTYGTGFVNAICDLVPLTPPG